MSLNAKKINHASLYLFNVLFSNNQSWDNQDNQSNLVLKHVQRKSSLIDQPFDNCVFRLIKMA